MRSPYSIVMTMGSRIDFSARQNAIDGAGERQFGAIVGVNSAVIALSALGVILPALSGALHNVSTVLTSMRSLRRYSPRGDGGDIAA